MWNMVKSIIPCVDKGINTQPSERIELSQSVHKDSGKTALAENEAKTSLPVHSVGITYPTAARVARMHSFNPRQTERDKNGSTSFPAAAALGGTSGSGEITQGTDCAKALKQLSQPGEKQGGNDFEVHVAALDMTENRQQLTGPEASRHLSTVNGWEQYAARVIAALDEAEKSGKVPPEDRGRLTQEINHMTAVMEVAGIMRRHLTGSGTKVLDSGQYYLIEISHGKQTQALGLLRHGDGFDSKTLTLEALVSHPQNNFDMDNQGRFKGAGKKALLATIDQAPALERVHDLLSSIARKAR